MADIGTKLAAPPLRPEYLRDVVASADIGVVQRPLTLSQQLANQAWLRKALILVVIAIAWEVYARWLNNPLLVPTFTATIEALWTGMIGGDLPEKVGNSVLLLLKGYGIGLALAMLLTALAMMSRIGNDLLETLTSAFNPLPAIALLPLALIWFGLGDLSIIFVLVHSVLWAVALNTHSGFRSVSNTLRMVGRNYGLKGPR
jgi:sulfonate transport system permease protein